MKAILLLMAAGVCFAQDPMQPKFYKFDFAVKEIDAGKVIGTKNYSSIGRARVSPPDSLMFRSGDKVPLTNGKGETTFIEVGTNIDCRILGETGGELVLAVSTDISSSGTDHVISQTRWNANVAVQMKKPTVVFTSESATKKIVTQLEVTVTPLQ